MNAPNPELVDILENTNPASLAMVLLSATEEFRDARMDRQVFLGSLGEVSAVELEQMKAITERIAEAEKLVVSSAFALMGSGILQRAVLLLDCDARGGTLAPFKRNPITKAAN